MVDRVDREILNVIATFQKANRYIPTYTLATHVTTLNKKNSESQSVGNIDSTFRYRCEKMFRQGLLDKDIDKKGEQPLVLYSLAPQGFAVSDGSLILMKNTLITEYFCPYTAQCQNCRLPESKEPLIFKPIKYVGNQFSKKYVAPNCLFLKEILGSTENMSDYYEAKQQLLRILTANNNLAVIASPT